MTPSTTRRPPLDRHTDADEFARWYWTKAELTAFARRLGLSASGDKQALAQRIRATLAGVPPDGPAPPPPRGAGQLGEDLGASTVVPAGQRCSQHLRRWFTTQVVGFRFDAPMREFFAAADGGQTLGDALAHWHATRDRPAAPIGEQFEYNRFARAWAASHPGSPRGDLLSAWRTYRDTPADQRG